MTFPAQLISYFNSQQYQIKYDTPGTYQFTVPEGVSSLSAVAIGGGGGGAGNDNTNITNTVGTGGGGGGGTTWAVFGVQPGDILTVNVAAGGTGGLQSVSYNGLRGGTSSISITSRGVNAIGQTIMQALGGGGGTRNANGSGVGGAGGTSFVDNTQTFCPIFLSGGGIGGIGGTSSTVGGSGGGGAGGYNGNGGNGGTITPTSQPTAAAANSGGGGGGGGATSELGYGGGGTGSFGFPGTGQGAAGSNNAGLGTGGGNGASYFIDPNEGIIADFVGQSISTTDSIEYPTGIGTGDFLLLFSGSDAFTGTGSPATNFTGIPVPSGFTTISQSYDNGVYKINSISSLQLGLTTAIIPSNIAAASASRDLHFTSSYTTVPEGGLSGTLTGLTTSSIHNMIALRDLPGRVSIAWSTTSGDPALNTTPTFTLMPDPPPVAGIGSGSLAIAVGFLSNTPLFPVGQTADNTAGGNTTHINSISGGVPGVSGEGIGLVASYMQTDTQREYDPDPFLTGTTAHSRAYSIQINRSQPGTQVTVVGSAVTSTLRTGGSVTSLNLPTGLEVPIAGDLLIYACANDNPSAAGANVPVLADVNGNSVGIAWTTINNGNSTDGRGGGGLGYRVSYTTLPSNYTGNATQLNSLSGGSAATPTAHIVIVLRGASYGNNAIPWDNGALSIYGPPNPPPITTTSDDALIIAIGMIDNIAISNVSTILPPRSLQNQGGIGNSSYTMLAQQSYGVQNNGLIIMSAYKNNLSAAALENPSNFVGGGGNIWAAQTIIIGGPETLGTKTDAGLYGGGGGSMSDSTAGAGMDGGQGSVRIIWGTGRRYPSSNQVNKSLFDSVP